MRLNCIAPDCPETLFACKELVRHMLIPSARDWETLKRLGRFLKGCPRIIQVIKQQKLAKFMDVYADSDHAGCLATRKSTSGGAL
eukprot:14460840-Heterocapsa_arctica.AAC.1